MYNIVLADIQSKTALIDENETAFCELLKEKLQSNNGLQEIKAKTTDIQRKLKKIDNKIKLLYNDRTEGVITKERFFELSAEFETESKSLKAELAELKKSEKQIADTQNNINQFITAVKKHCLGMQGLTAEILNTLIDKIEVHNKIKAENGYIQQVVIYYRFIGNV